MTACWYESQIPEDFPCSHATSKPNSGCGGDPSVTVERERPNSDAGSRDGRVSLYPREIRFELTPAGEALKPYAEEMLAIEDEARAAVAATMQDEGGSLTIGALETIASSRLAHWLSRFRTNHPQIDLRLRIGSSGELIDKLERREIDIAFCFHEGDVDERLVKRTVAKEPISLIGSPDRASVDDPLI